MAGWTRLLASVGRMGTPPRTRLLVEVSAVRGVLRLPVRIEARGLDVRHVAMLPGESAEVDHHGTRVDRLSDILDRHVLAGYPRRVPRVVHGRYLREVKPYFGELARRFWLLRSGA